jgi:hypothetical protein
MIAEGGTIHVTGGIFGESGVNDGGLVRAAFGGLVHFMGAEIAGADDGTAPVATLSALTNGELNVSDVAFGDLVLEANTGGTVNVGDITAENISVSMLGGGTVNFQAGEADSLEVLAELESFVNLRGGHFGVIDVTLQTNSVLTIFGNSFTFFGTPVELLPEEAFVRETGELRTIGGISALAGALADGMPFSLSYSRQLNPPGTRVFLIRVPEPTGLALAALAAAGLGACRVRGREQS